MLKSIQSLHFFLPVHNQGPIKPQFKASKTQINISASVVIQQMNAELTVKNKQQMQLSTNHMQGTDCMSNSEPRPQPEHYQDWKASQAISIINMMNMFAQWIKPLIVYNSLHYTMTRCMCQNKTKHTKQKIENEKIFLRSQRKSHVRPSSGKRFACFVCFRLT